MSLADPPSILGKRDISSTLAEMNAMSIYPGEYVKGNKQAKEEDYQRFHKLQFGDTKTDTVVTAKVLKKHIENFIKDPRDTNCDLVLGSIYKFVKENGKLEEEEKKDLGILLKKSAELIFDYLANFTYDFQPEYVIDLLIFRSAVQFLVDEFKSLPTGVQGETLETVLKELMKKYNIINEMDETIAHWKSYNTGMSDCELYTSEDFKTPDGVPKSHDWWNF